MANHPALRDELLEHLDGFLNWHQHNRAHLVKTGYPQTKFLPSALLEEHLGLLYPVKHPLRVEEVEDEAGQIVYNYIWDASGGVASYETAAYFLQDAPGEKTNYQSSLIRVDKERAVMYTLTETALSLVGLASLSTNLGSPFEQFLKEMEESLSIEEEEFWWRDQSATEKGCVLRTLLFLTGEVAGLRPGEVFVLAAKAHQRRCRHEEKETQRSPLNAGEDFDHSPTYTMVWLRGKDFPLSEEIALIVEALHKATRHTLSEGELCLALNKTAKTDRIKDAFRGTYKNYLGDEGNKDALVVKVKYPRKQRVYFRLNL